MTSTPLDSVAHKAAEVARARPVPPALRPWVGPLARVGHVAKAVVYLTIGALAAKGALGWGGTAADGRRAVEVLGRRGGAWVPAFLGAGLLCYAAWRLVQGLLDTDHKGTGWGGLGARAAQVGSGIAHLMFAMGAFAVALGSHDEGGGVARWTAAAMSAPIGQAVVVVAGLVVIGVAVAQLVQAVRDTFADDFDLARMSRYERKWAIRLGRAGHAARGVTFAIVGWFLVRAGLHTDPGEARGLAGALRFLRAQEHGDVFLALVALGLAAYGLFMLFMARYRRIGGSRA